MVTVYCGFNDADLAFIICCRSYNSCPSNTHFLLKDTFSFSCFIHIVVLPFCLSVGFGKVNVSSIGISMEYLQDKRGFLCAYLYVVGFDNLNVISIGISRENL